MKKIILGLDVSTTTIGVCLMEYDKDNIKILKLTHVSPKINSKIKGIESLCLKCKIFEDEFINNYKDFGITDVIIEEPLLRSNNVNTIATLLKFNGMISNSIYRKIGIIPEYISSYDARAYGFPELFEVRKLNKKDIPYPIKEIRKCLAINKLVLFGGFKWDVAKKNVLLDKISEKFNDIEWIYDKNGDLKKENFDASDSIVCILGYINKIKYKKIDPIVKIINDDNEHINYDVLIWNNVYNHNISF
jgi:hypothetical protein